MIEGIHPMLQTFLGTLFTWGLTALGSALVFVFQSGQVINSAGSSQKLGFKQAGHVFLYMQKEVGGGSRYYNFA